MGSDSHLIATGLVVLGLSVEFKMFDYDEKLAFHNEVVKRVKCMVGTDTQLTFITLTVTLYS